MQGSKQKGRGQTSHLLGHVRASCGVHWPLVRSFAAISAELAIPAFLVGGVVRDSICRVPSKDLDIVWQGDVVAPAEQMVQRMGGSITAKSVFGTLQWRSPGGVVVDLIQARQEHYPAPAALPQVQFGTIDADLWRRDFSCNAMAIALLPHGIGPLLDPCGGLLALERRQLRILHDNSFEDDPTRLLRGARMAARLGARWCPHTAVCVRAAVAQQVLSLLSKDRLWAELTLVWTEQAAVSALAYLYHWGILSQILPGVRWSRRLANQLRTGQAWLIALGYQHLAAELLPMLMATYVPAATAESWSALLARNQQQQQTWRWLSSKAASQLAAHSRGSRAQLASWLSTLSLVQQLWCTAQSNQASWRASFAWWWRTGRWVRSKATAKQWLAKGFAPGPAFQQASKEAQLLAWQGKAPAQQGQRAQQVLTAWSKPAS